VWDLPKTTRRTSHRLSIDAELRAEFRQLGLEFPLLHLGGGWSIRRLERFSEVTLEHEFEAPPEAPPSATATAAALAPSSAWHA
jgi:hypothetical protein